VGDCALTNTPIENENALCSASGYIYAESAILEYLLTKTQELKAQKIAYEKQQLNKQDDDTEKRKQRADFAASQKLFQISSSEGDKKDAATSDLKRVSYWLAGAQPESTNERDVAPPPERPMSPISGEPLRRKDLWPVSILRENNKLICCISHKPIRNHEIVAYWTDKKDPGKIVLKSVYDELVTKKRCPITDKKIRYDRVLQRSGSSFASSGQELEVKKYRPTIT
jgi:nitric oxide synthase-interacting protein